MAPREIPEWTLTDILDTRRWWKNRGLLVLNICLLLPLMTSIVNGLDSSLVNGLQILPDWQEFFHHPTGKTLGIINSAQFIGNLVGIPLSPLISDTFGRRASLFVGSLIMLGGVAVQATSWNIPMLIGGRVTIGFGLSFSANAAPLLLVELSYPTHRGKVTSMYNSAWYFGSIISAWVCFGSFQRAQGSEWSWRVPTLVQAFLPIIQVLAIWFIPESPRWLVSKGREGQAAAILAKYHSNHGDERDPLVVFEMAQIRHAMRIEEQISQSTSYLSLFSTQGNRKRMRLIVAIAVFSQWSGNGLVSYYINLVLEGVGIKSTETKAAINGGLQVFNFLVAMAASMLVDWLGRRTLFIISNSGMLVAFISWTISAALYNTLHITAAAKATIPLIFLFYFFYDIAYTPMVVSYSLEILPYRVRAKGFAFMNVLIMLTVAFNQFINPWALAAIGWWYYVVYCAWLFVELAFVLVFIIETKGRTLEETAAMFDSADQPRDLVAMGEDAATTSIMNRRTIENFKRRSHLHHRINVTITQEIEMARTYSRDSDSEERRDYAKM